MLYFCLENWGGRTVVFSNYTKTRAISELLLGSRKPFASKLLFPSVINLLSWIEDIGYDCFIFICYTFSFCFDINFNLQVYSYISACLDWLPFIWLNFHEVPKVKSCFCNSRLSYVNENPNTLLIYYYFFVLLKLLF